MQRDANLQRAVLHLFLRAVGQCLRANSPGASATARLEAADCTGRERLLRHCARPLFARERLRELDPDRLVYDKPRPGPGAPATLAPTPLQLVDRPATPVPPSRIHRHRHFGVLARTAGHEKFPRRPRTAENGRQSVVAGSQFTRKRSYDSVLEPRATWQGARRRSNTAGDDRRRARTDPPIRHTRPTRPTSPPPARG